MRVAMIEWWCSSILHLSLEKYYNAGITPARAKEIIEGVRDFVGCLNLWCEPGGVNNNWNVRTRVNNVEMQRDLVIHLTDLMEAELKRMKADVEK